MKRPPVMMRLKIRGEDSGFDLWLPLFLLLPLALVVFIILSPLILTAIIVLWPSGWGKRALLVLGTGLWVLCSMRGLKVNIKSRQQYVFINVV